MSRAKALLPLGRGGNGTVALLALLAVVIGGLVPTHPTAAAAALLTAAVWLLVLASPRFLPVFLVFTMFVESLSLGAGLRIGRLAGAMALVVIVTYVLVHGRQGLRANALLAAAAAYGLWLLASVYWASDSAFVYAELSSYVLAVAYTLAFAVLVRRREQLRMIFVTFAFGSLAFGILSFVTYVTSSGTERASGLQGDPNYFAVYQVIALPAALSLASLERRPGRRLALYGVIAVIVLSVVSSLSRTGLVALVGVILATLLVPWRVFFRHPRQKGAYMLALLGAAGLAAMVGSAAFVARAQTILQPDAQDRGAGRIDLWAAAVRGFHLHPWFGLGAGNFQARSLDLLTTTPGVDLRASYVAVGRPVHNAYLETLTELGVVGFALFLLVIFLTALSLFGVARRARAVRDREMERLTWALLVALFGFSLSAIFLSNQLGKPLWIFVGLAVALDVMTRDLARGGSELSTATVPAAPVVERFRQWRFQE